MEEKPENRSSSISQSSLFPLFPISNKSLESSQSQQSQWLSNTSFTTDFSIVNQSISSHIQILKQSEQSSESNSDEDESIPKPSYTILKSSESESESTRRYKKKKTKKKKRKRSSETVDYGSRKRGVRAWDDSVTKPEKGYYFDSRGDQDNLTYGSLYRMDVARYKPLQSNELRGVNTQFLRSSKQRGSLLDGEQDTDVVDEKLKSGGRYWSTKYSVLERHKDFKRVKIAASSESIEFSEFLPLTSDDEDESGPTSNAVEESWEDEVLRKTREFNKMTRESPHDEKIWLAFAEFQDKVASRQPQKGARLQTLEKKISILEKAIELNPDNEEILLFLMKAFQSRDNTEVLIERWEKILVQRSGSYKLWREFLRVIQGDFSRFKVSEVRKMYAHAIQALSEACLKLSRQGHQTTMQRHDIVQLELGLVDTFVSFCRFEWQSGYQELASALFQAEIEFTLFCPSLSLTEQSRLRLFEHFWNGNCARVGEDGALGWSMWLAKEEEDRRKVVVEDSAEEDKGSWTGWSEPSSTNKGVNNNPEGLEDNDVIENGVEQALETEDVQQEDDIEYLMKKMGIDVDGEVDCEVKDPSTWIRWSEEELSRDREQWMPMREQSVLPDEPSEREGDEQLLRVILFEDICEYLCTLSSEEARFSLLSQFIDFFSGKISQWGCTNSSSWMAKILSLETFADSILDDLKKVEETITQVQSDSSSLTWESLLGSSFDISSRTSMMKFLRNAVSLCLTAFPRNYILEEAALTCEELFTTKMNSHICGTTPSRALAKVLLKNDRQDLLLCGVYARKEAAFGNHDAARKVFDMALSSVTELPLDLQSNIPLLYLWYAEMELSIISNEGSESASSRAVHILSCLGSGVKYSVYTSLPSSPQLLRARQGFKERMRMLLATWTHGDIKDGSVAFVCAAALFEDLASGEASGVNVIKGAFSMVLPERRSQSTQMESLFNRYIKILEKHYKQSNPSRVFSSIVEGLQIYPYNSKLFSSFVEVGRLHTVPNKIRRMFDEFCHTKPSVISWLFALAYELSKAGSQHRIHALFERALSDERLRDSVILWRCYIAYEVDVACNPKSARRIYFRAINACPWSKKLWLDGFRKLSSILSAKELSDLQEVMRDKEVNLRTDIYEILLQDDINP